VSVIQPLHAARSQRRAREMGGERLFVIGLDDTLFETVPAAGREPHEGEDDLCVEYVRGSELRELGTGADLWIGPYEPSAPGRRLLFVTQAPETFEQDDAGFVYMDGDQVWDEPLLGCGVPGPLQDRTLRLGSPVALLFGSRVAGGWSLRIRVAPPLVLLASRPDVYERGIWVPGWLRVPAMVAYFQSKAQRAADVEIDEADLRDRSEVPLDGEAAR
jgi:hypothetical protein